MMMKVTGAAKAPRRVNLNRKMNSRLTRHSPQAKAEANSYWLVRGSRPAATPRRTMAAVCTRRPRTWTAVAPLPRASFFMATNRK